MKKLTIEMLPTGNLQIKNEGFTDYEILGIIEIIRVRTVTDSVNQFEKIKTDPNQLPIDGLH